MLRFIAYTSEIDAYALLFQYLTFTILHKRTIQGTVFSKLNVMLK